MINTRLKKTFFVTLTTCLDYVNVRRFLAVLAKPPPSSSKRVSYSYTVFRGRNFLVAKQRCTQHAVHG